jgi:hypothetical protein
VEEAAHKCDNAALKLRSLLEIVHIKSNLDLILLCDLLFIYHHVKPLVFCNLLNGRSCIEIFNQALLYEVNRKFTLFVVFRKSGVVWLSV